MQPSLNPEQKRAVEAPLKPLLIVAGAGTGKTRVLTSRLLHLILEGVPPQSIAAITFTNKAAREMENRVKGALRGKEGKPFLGTFHSFGARILRSEARRLGRTPDFVIFDDHDSLNLLKRLLKNLGVRSKKFGPAWYSHKISELKNDPVYAFGEPVRDAIGEVYIKYEGELTRNNAFDFDDLIQKVVLLLQREPAILKKYSERYRHILVDEFQDVNDMQYELVRALGRGAESLSAVGDSDQTIYSWRGSNIKIFLGFEQDWKSTVVFLGENYRSTQNILAAAQALIAHNKERSAAHTTGSLHTMNAPGKPIMIFEAGSAENEAEWISQKIETEKIVDSTTAILYRTNAQSRALEQALIAHSISYRIYGGLKFYERREIKDIVAGLRIAANPQDSVSQERLEKAFSKRTFRVLAEALNGAGKEPLKLIQTFIEATDYLTFLAKYTANPEERRENIAELMRFAGEFKTLSEFLERITLLQATDETKEDAEPEVQLMTIHLAKGLEFDRVFIAGAAEGLMPHVRSLESASGVEEERRLMYVAMTRARKELFLSFYDVPSRFLFELPQKRVEFQTETSEDINLRDREERYISLD